MAGWHESGRVGEVRDVLMWFADRRRDKKQDDVDSNMTAKGKLFSVGHVSELETEVGWHMGVAGDARQEANS
jgi:hypothetical protein